MGWVIVAIVAWIGVCLLVAKMMQEPSSPPRICAHHWEHSDEHLHTCSRSWGHAGECVCVCGDAEMQIDWGV